jgi:hypothetical protein
MAFRLAEVRSAVESAPTPEAREGALAEQDSLIMALWRQRHTLPAPLGVDRRTGTASRIIQQLVSDPSVWNRPDTPRNAVEALGALRDEWAYLICSAAILTYKREAIALGPEDSYLPLTDEEREERKRLAELADRVLGDIRRREGSPYPGSEPSDTEAVLKLERATGKAIAALRAHLDRLEPMLLPAAETIQPKKPRRSVKRD